MSNTCTWRVSKLEVLSAVNKANRGNPTSLEHDVVLLNNTWNKVLQYEKDSNSYLHDILVSKTDYDILIKHGIKSMDDRVTYNNTDSKCFRAIRKVLISLFSIFGH